MYYGYTKKGNKNVDDRIRRKLQEHMDEWRMTGYWKPLYIAALLVGAHVKTGGQHGK